MKALRLSVAVLTFLFGLTVVRGDDKPETGFLNRVYKDADGKESKYVVFVPHAKSEKPLPVVLFLHGAGATGDDGKKQVSGIAAAIRKAEKAFPAVVVFPQSQKRSWRAAS